MKLKSTLICLFYLLAIETSILAQSWSPVGTSPYCGESVIDGAGNIYVLNSYYVYKFNGSNWSNIGNPFVGASWPSVFYYRLSVTTAGVPYMTYHYNTAVVVTSGFIMRSFVSYYNGGSWVKLNNADINNDIETHFPSFDCENKVVGFNTVTSGNIQIKKFTTSWVSIGTITNTNIFPNTTLDHDNLGNTYIIYSENGNINVKKTDGTTISNVGSTIPTNNYCSDCLKWKIPLCISPANIPHFAYVENVASSYTIIVYRYKNSTWEKITGPSLSASINPVSIGVSSNDVIYIGYTSGGIGKIVYYNNSNWNEVGTQNFTGVVSTKISPTDILYKDGCEKYDISAITLSSETANQEVQNDFLFITNERGIEIKTNLKEQLAINIFDQAGKSIANFTGIINSDLIIPIENSGLYYIKIENEHIFKSHKVYFSK